MSYTNPLELVRGELGELFYQEDCGPVSENDEEYVERMNIESRLLGFTGAAYWVRSEKGIVVPTELPAKKSNFKGPAIKLANIVFSGRLEEYPKSCFEAGQWCIMFGDVTLVPGLEELSDCRKLWVPVASIAEIELL